MKTIAIIAPTGMLGSALYSKLKDKYNLILVLRDVKKIDALKKEYGEAKNAIIHEYDIAETLEEYKKGFSDKNNSVSIEKLFEALKNADTVVNCAGITNRYSSEISEQAMFINSIFPHILSEKLGEKLIHITTDCAFSGLSGAPYDENSPKNPTDLYGISKVAGEPYKNSLVIRTSIIGPEITGFVSLLEWIRKQDGKEINGYSNHLWNGITTFEFARVCDEITSNRKKYPSKGLFHVFSNDVNKFEMITKIAKKYNINCKINPDSKNKLDRRLSTVHSLCADLNIKSFDEMLNELN